MIIAMLMRTGRISYAKLTTLVVLCFLSALCQLAYAWGVDGHQIVATIAQTQLHPDVRAYLCTILPREATSYKSFYPHTPDGKPNEHCHLAPLAAWADTVRQQYPWASHLHYVNPVQDDPPRHCAYGQYGWQDHGSGNVLEALVNYTSILSTAPSATAARDIALRFVVHFMGDLHQPLHLTGRARGGNDIAVHFNGRFARLHSVWDSLLLNDQIRDLANNTSPLPSARIESALMGKRYDAYIRWILTEGLGQAVPGDNPAWWRDESQTWTLCPADSNRMPVLDTSSSKRRTHWLRSVAPHSTHVANRIYSTIFRQVAKESMLRDPSYIDDNDLPICPYAWSKPMHELVCSYAFAEPVPSDNLANNGMPRGPLREVNVPEYAGRIGDDKIIQRQLARAGIRLAAVLNTLLLPEAQKRHFATVRMRNASTERHSIRVGDAQSINDESQDAVNIDMKKKPPFKHGGHHSGGNQGSNSAILGLIKVTASSIAEVILLSSVGYMLARRGVLDKRTQTKINKVNVSFFTPALLFSKVAFSLDPGRLAELIIVPAGFVIIVCVSAFSAILLSWMARLSKSQRNFSVACAITPNSNSLPVALMQSLVVTVPQLHWEEEGEPEDTVNSMLGRALTYLVLFSTLGMFLRWSLASQLLSTMDDTEGETDEEPVTGTAQDTSQNEPPTGRLVDVDEASSHQQPVDNSVRKDADHPPPINVRRATEDGGATENISRGGRHRWARSFPNSPDDSDDDGDSSPLLSPRWQRRRSTYLGTAKRMYHAGLVKPFRAVTRFMTMPLYAALISLLVAMIPPVQNLLSQIEPLVGALETAGACSIPLTMVVLGAYFYEESDETKTATNGHTNTNVHRQVAAVSSESSNDTAVWPMQNEQSGNGGADSAQATLVNSSQASRRKSLPFMRNPWKSGSTNGDSEAGSRTGSVADASSDALMASGGRMSLQTEQREKHKQTMEKRTIVVAVASRMLLTPIILLPFLAWYAIATRYNVVDDPVFLTSACLLIGSPPALTLAQITSQSAKGSNSSFERLISKTIFVSYAIAATPTTIILVMTALLIAENDH